MKRFLFAWASMLSVMVALSPTQASTRSALSPAGKEIIKAVYGRISLDIIAISRKRSETRSKIELQLRAVQCDWKMINNLIEQEFNDQVNLRKIDHTAQRAILKKLSEADRIIFLSDEYSTSSLPPIVSIQRR